MDPTPFPFLGLHRDVRLLMYEHLISRTHHSIIKRSEDAQVVTLTLVQHDPIIPIHLTSRSLLAQAGPFLKSKVERMSASLATLPIGSIR